MTSSQGIEDPLDLLAKGMRQVAKGHFDTRLDEWPDEPLHSMFNDFNHMAECLLDVEAMRESFVSNVAHEFKTPLSYIQGYATLLQDDSLPSGKRDTYITNITNTFLMTLYQDRCKRFYRIFCFCNNIIIHKILCNTRTIIISSVKPNAIIVTVVNMQLAPAASRSSLNRVVVVNMMKSNLALLS